MHRCSRIIVLAHMRLQRLLLWCKRATRIEKRLLILCILYGYAFYSLGGEVFNAADMVEAIFLRNGL